MSKTVRMSLSAVETLATNALEAQGFSAAQAAAIAATVTAAERDDCTSHGLFRIPFYVKALGNPSADPEAIPVLTTDDSAVVRVDARNGFCPLALQTGFEPVEAAARKHGIAALVINNAYNIAALWPEVEHLATRNLVAMAFTCATSTVAPHGGTKPLFGTNPIAFGFPRRGNPPLVFDQATSVCARGEIQLHLRSGKPIPPGWAIGPDGEPTTDPATALAGAQLPFGGHKGSALSMMVELLAGALIGDLFSFEASVHDVNKVGAPFGGELMLVMDPARFNPSGDAEVTMAHAEELFARILEQDGTRLPSSRRQRARLRTSKEGVDVNADLHETITGYLKH